MKQSKINDLVETIIRIGSDSSLMNAFLTDLLTPTEYIEIKKRWEIVKMLDSSVPQNMIAKKLGVGIATVTRGSRVLRNSKGGFKKMLK